MKIQAQTDNIETCRRIARLFRSAGHHDAAARMDALVMAAVVRKVIMKHDLLWRLESVMINAGSKLRVEVV